MAVIPDNIKKVAVTMDKAEQAQFIELDQGKPLAAVISDLCERWGLTNSNDYALQFNETLRHDFITERNRTDIQKGYILKLTLSPAKTAADILEKLSCGDGGVDRQRDVVKQLSELANDYTFAQEFIAKDGHRIVIDMIQKNKHTGESLSYLLKAFVELMDHGIVSWDLIESTFIKVVASHTVVTKGSTITSTLQYALEILESVSLNSSENYLMVEQDVTPMSLMHHLESTNPDLQKNAIALINALFMRADTEKRRKITTHLGQRSIRNIILNNVIRTSREIGVEMAHQLYVLQSLMFSLYEEKKSTPVDPQDKERIDDITYLRKTAFDTDRDPQQVVSKRQSNAEDYRKLGFQNVMSPIDDFLVTPPGSLALSNMVYFAKNHAENYTKVVLENSFRADDHDLPFAKASIELTKVLCDILKVGEPPSDEGSLYYPMFFTHDCPFEEFYCVCIQLLNKTWKEMRATAADFTKVLSVVRDQIERALNMKPPTTDKFRQNLSHFTYAKITEIWQQERRTKEETEAQARPIAELREAIKPEILELIKQQRLNCLVEGTRFLKHNKRKDKHWFCRLSPNHKVFHYGDCEEGTQPSTDQLPHKLNVVDIKSLKVGKDCPHVNQKGKKVPAQYAFSIISEADMGEPINFNAPSEFEFSVWTDGINALLGNPMTSKKTETDLTTLLSMEIKLRLLDTEGIKIPEQAPPIPKEPPNYNFAYG